MKRASGSNGCVGDGIWRRLPAISIGLFGVLGLTAAGCGSPGSASDAGPDGSVVLDGALDLGDTDGGGCGDGVVQAGEACDDGANNGEGPGMCRPDCSLPYCGDGVLDPGEACDEGSANAETPGACRPWCAAPSCGDGVLDPAETCDDGFANNDRAEGACRTTCVPATCGDGTQDDGEACDEGEAASDVRPDACRLNCVSAACGDGVVDTGEECDLGAANQDSFADGCRTSCRLPFCGDGLWDKNTEGCDRGLQNSDVASGACRTDCARPRCGDAVVDPGETCDDGNDVETDSCDGTCQSTACPSPLPATCRPTTTTVPSSGGQTVCQVLAASSSIAQYRAHPGIQALNITAVNASADACIEHYLPTCMPFGCPCLPVGEPYTVELCVAVAGRTNLHPVCAAAITSNCANVYDRECTAPTLSDCADDRIRSQTQAGGGAKAACAAYVASECDSLAAAACPAITLATCDAWSRDRSSYGGAECGWYAADRCPAVLATCPGPNLVRCSDLDTFSSTLDPICAARLAPRCAGWEERYCPINVVGGPSVDADNCLRQYDVLESDRLVECHPWLAATCERLVVAQMQGHLASTDLCNTHIAREGTGFDYTIVPGVTEPGPYDCTQAELRGIQPAQLSFDATTAEALSGGLEVVAVQQRLAGVSVRDCAEYVDQRYWSHTAFRAYTKHFDHDSRRVLQLAYATTEPYLPFAIGTRGFLPELPFGHYPDHSPELLDPAEPYALTPPLGAPAPKNDFVSLLSAEHADALQSFTNATYETEPLLRELLRERNTAIRTRMERVRSYWQLGNAFSVEDGWHWHPRMSTSMAQQGYTDEELYHLYERRQRFRELLIQRGQRGEMLDLLGMQAIQDVSRIQRIQAEMRVLNTEIAALLVDADARGCFADRRRPDGRPIPSPCDWAPRDFMDDVDDLFARRRDASLATCQRYAPTDFDTLSSGYAYLVEGITEPRWLSEDTDPRASVAAFDTYLARRAETTRLLGEALGATDDTRRPLWGQSWADGDQIGDPAWFAAGWDAALAWSVDVPAGADGLCGIDAHASGSMAAYVVLRNDRRDLIDAGLDAAVRDERFATHLTMLGYDLWNENLGSSTGPIATGFTGADYDFNVVFDNAGETVERESSLEVPVFSIAGFDIVLNIGAAGRLGAEFGGELRLSVDDDSGCGPGLDMSLGGHVRPFMELDGFAEVGIDLWVVELGIGGSLRLLDVAVPFRVGIGAGTSGPLQQVIRANLNVNVASQVELASLSGRVYLYAETFWDTYRKTVFAWEGYEWTIPLFDKNYTYELGALQLYCNPVDRCL